MEKFNVLKYLIRIIIRPSCVIATEKTCIHGNQFVIVSHCLRGSLNAEKGTRMAVPTNTTVKSGGGKDFVRNSAPLLF